MWEFLMCYNILDVIPSYPFNEIHWKSYGNSREDTHRENVDTDTSIITHIFKVERPLRNSKDP